MSDPEDDLYILAGDTNDLRVVDSVGLRIDDTPKPIDWTFTDCRANRQTLIFRLEVDRETIIFGPEFRAALEKVIRETILAVHRESMVPQKETER